MVTSELLMPFTVLEPYLVSNWGCTEKRLNVESFIKIASWLY